MRAAHNCSESSVTYVCFKAVVVRHSFAIIGLQQLLCMLQSFCMVIHVSIMDLLVASPKAVTRAADMHAGVVAHESGEALGGGVLAMRDVLPPKRLYAHRPVIRLRSM